MFICASALKLAAISTPANKIPADFFICLLLLLYIPDDKKRIAVSLSG
jgi:hypothetical protein